MLHNKKHLLLICITCLTLLLVYSLVEYVQTKALVYLVFAGVLLAVKLIMIWLTYTINTFALPTGDAHYDFLSAVLDNIEDGIVACDKDGNLSLFNRATHRFHGIDLKKISAEQWAGTYSLYHADGITPMKKEEIPLLRAFNGEVVNNVEMVVVQKGGRRVHLVASGNRIIGHQGEILGAVVSMHDVTAIKEAEEKVQMAGQELKKLNAQLEKKVLERTLQLEVEKIALKKEMERNRIVSKATRDVVWDWDLLTDEITWNENLQDLYGYNVSSVKNGAESWKSRIHDDDRARIIREVYEVINNPAKSQWVSEYKFRKANSEYADVLDRAYILRNEENQPYRMVGCMSDISIQKHAAEEIRLKDAKFRRVFDSDMIGILFCGPSGQIREANDAFLRIIGYTRDDLEQDRISWRTMTPPEYKESSEDALQQLLETGHCRPFEKEYFRKDGSRVSVMIGSTLAHELDAGANIITYVIDISDKKRAEQIEQQFQDQFKFLVNNLPHKIWIADRKGNILYYNDVFLKYTGTENNEWQNIIHPDDLAERAALWERSVLTGQAFEIDSRIVDRYGNYRWHLSRATPSRNADGEIMMWVGSSTDIHDQKSLSEALRISEDYFREVAEHTPFMIWKVDEQAKCSYVNSRWIKYTGLSFEQSLGTGWMNAVHPEDREKEYGKFVECFNAFIPYDSTFRVKGTDGIYRWFLSQSNPLGSNQQKGYIGSLTDIHSQVLAEEASQQQIRQKDEFLSIASHELKTPITSTKAAMQIIERMVAGKPGLEQLEGFIQKASRQTNKLADLINDLLDVSRLQAGKLQFNISEFILAEVIQDSLDHFADSGYRFNCSGDMQVRVRADRHRIEQVLVNFISNGIKYSPGSNIIDLLCVIEDDNVKVAVTDRGIGIPEDKQSEVFGRFFRVEESSQKFSGLGLGLFISSEIIKRHNGTFGVTSKLKQGSTFWFTLPVNEC